MIVIIIIRAGETTLSHSICLTDFEKQMNFFKLINNLKRFICARKLTRIGSNNYILTNKMSSLTHTFPPQGINSIKQVSSSSLPRNESLSSRQYRVLCLCQTANWLISLQRGKPQKCIKRENFVWFQQYSQHSPSVITTSTVLIPVHWYKHTHMEKK